MSETVDHTGEVPLTIYLPAPKAGEEWGVKRSHDDRSYFVEFTLRPIARKPYEPFTYRSMIALCDRKDGHGAHPGCSGRLPNETDRKPCPVMVCPHSLERPGLTPYCGSVNHDDRRPCTLTEGHEKDGSAHA